MVLLGGGGFRLSVPFVQEFNSAPGLSCRGKAGGGICAAHICAYFYFLSFCAYLRIFCAYLRIFIFIAYFYLQFFSLSHVQIGLRMLLCACLLAAIPFQMPYFLFLSSDFLHMSDSGNSSASFCAKYQIISLFNHNCAYFSSFLLIFTHKCAYLRIFRAYF